MFKKFLSLLLCLTVILSTCMIFISPVHAQTSPMIGQSISPWPSPISNIDAQETHIGRHIDVVEHWIDWSNPFSDMSDECDAIYTNGSILEMCWQPQNGSGAITNSQINNGSQDTYLHQYAKDVKAWGKTIWIRLMHEMNGNWYGWSPNLNGNTTQSYINAYRRVVDIFRQEGATNVKWVYSVAQDNSVANGVTQSFMGQYPGDTYVDYMSIDVYNWGTNHPEWPSSWKSFEQCVATAYNVVKTPGKPIIISEYGCVENGGSKSQWITDAFNVVRNSGRYDLIMAMNYFDLKPGTDDWRLDSSTTALNAYKAAINYQSGVTPTPTPTPTPAAGTNLALNKSATASSVEKTGFEAGKAFDGNTTTRWAAAFTGDPQWIYADLGSSQSVNRVKLNWETAYAKSYQIQVSNDASTWTNVYSTTTGDGGIDDITFTATNGRYVRMYGTARANTSYSYSIWEFEVYGGTTPTPTPTPSPTATPTPTPTPAANLALNKTATASSVEKAGFEAGKAFDGNNTTRWAAAFTGDPQWIYVDLGSSKTVRRVKLNWETAYAKSYQIQVSNDASTWTNVYSTTTGDGGIDDITFTATSARYVRMYGTARANTAYSYSIWEFEVY
jgi:hypothetical protein